MKIRYDFVTNSSSSSFVVRIGIKLNNGKEYKYEAFAEDDGGGCDYGEVEVDRNLFRKVASASSVDALLKLLEKAVSYSFAEGDDCYYTDHFFDPKDFELYSGLKKKSYTKEDYDEATCGFGSTKDDPEDGRSVPFSKSIIIFDKAVRKNVKDLEEIKSVIVEGVHTASGEFISEMHFSDLDWTESGMCAQAVSVEEMDLKTGEVKKESSTEWI